MQEFVAFDVDEIHCTGGFQPGDEMLHQTRFARARSEKKVVFIRRIFLGAGRSD